jgi:hypothetical protein
MLRGGASITPRSIRPGLATAGHLRVRRVAVGASQVSYNPNVERIPRDRPVRRIPLAEEGQAESLQPFTASERVGMMWQLAMQGWMFKEGLLDEPRLRRDVVRTIRGRR